MECGIINWTLSVAALVWLLAKYEPERKSLRQCSNEIFLPHIKKSPLRVPIMAIPNELGWIFSSILKLIATPNGFILL